MENQEEHYLCVGVCMSDPASGYCLGCGRPPLAVPGEAAEQAPIATPATPAEPDSPNS